MLKLIKSGTTKIKNQINSLWGILLLPITFSLLPFLVSCSNESKNGGRQNSRSEAVEVTQEMLSADHRITARIDSFIHIPQRLTMDSVAISVFDATTQQQVFSHNDTMSFIPASTMKLITALTALKDLGLNHRLCESLQIRGEVKDGILRGNLLLRADADPLLLSLDTLVMKLKARGINRIEGNVYLALEKIDTLRAHPTAKLWDITYNKLPLLVKGEKRVKRELLTTLSLRGITYHHNDSIHPQGKYRVIAQSSHKLTDVLSPMLIHSSNIKAEIVLSHLDTKAGIIRDHKTHWDDITHASELFVDKEFFADESPFKTSANRKSIVIKDGSGLSPYNRLTAHFLVDILTCAYEDKTIRDFFINEALACPGDANRHGSMLGRMAKPQYQNRIFVKTGTLVTQGGSSLAGFIHARDDHWYIFSIINVGSPVAESRIFQDNICKLFFK